MGIGVCEVLMGVADNTLLDLIGKVRSWIYWGTSDLTSISGEVKMTDGGQTMCCQCEIRVSESCLGYHCQKCSRLFCERCVQGYGYGSFVVVESKSGTQAGLHLRSCRFCGNLDVKQKIGENLVIRYILPIHLVKAQNHLHQIVSGMLLYL